MEKLAFLRTQGRVFLLLESSLLGAHSVFPGFLPLCSGHSFCLVCRPLLLYPVTKREGSSKLVLGPFFLPYTHSQMGSTLPSSNVTSEVLTPKPFLPQTSLSFNPQIQLWIDYVYYDVSNSHRAPERTQDLPSSPK